MPFFFKKTSGVVAASCVKAGGLRQTGWTLTLEQRGTIEIESYTQRDYESDDAAGDNRRLHALHRASGRAASGSAGGECDGSGLGYGAEGERLMRNARENSWEQHTTGHEEHRSGPYRL